jgi:hypothetical protein
MEKNSKVVHSGKMTHYIPEMYISILDQKYSNGDFKQQQWGQKK